MRKPSLASVAAMAGRSQCLGSLEAQLFGTRIRITSFIRNIIQRRMKREWSKCLATSA